MIRGILLMLCGLCLTGCVAVNQGSRPMGSITGQVDSPPEPGQWCRVTYPETRYGFFERHQSVVTGKVESIDEEGLHVSEVIGREMVDVPVAEKIPMIRRFFNSSGIGVERNRVVQLDGTEQVEIISEQEGRQESPPAAQDQNIAQQLVAAVPMHR